MADTTQTFLVIFLLFFLNSKRTKCVFMSTGAGGRKCHTRVSVCMLRLFVSWCSCQPPHPSAQNHLLTASRLTQEHYSIHTQPGCLEKATPCLQSHDPEEVGNPLHNLRISHSLSERRKRGKREYAGRVIRREKKTSKRDLKCRASAWDFAFLSCHEQYSEVIQPPNPMCLHR